MKMQITGSEDDKPEGLKEKQEILDELNELLNIPQFERIVFHKIKELKNYFQEEIERYRYLKESFKRTAYGSMQVLDSQNQVEGKIQVYHFELNRSKEGEWEATTLVPDPPPGYEIYDIIPEEMVEYIGSFKTARQQIENQTQLSLPALQGIAFDLSFIKYSDWYILGTIKNYKLPSADGADREIPDHMTEIYNYDKQETDKGNYQELIYYMKKYPALRRYFLTELHMKMKPLIIGNLVEITASSQPVGLF